LEWGTGDALSFHEVRASAAARTIRYVAVRKCPPGHATQKIILQRHDPSGPNFSGLTPPGTKFGQQMGRAGQARTPRASAVSVAWPICQTLFPAESCSWRSTIAGGWPSARGGGGGSRSSGTALGLKREADITGHEHSGCAREMDFFLTMLL
jgi:hypothetical protein